MMINPKAALTALLLIFLSACSEPTIDRDELVERDGILYEKFSNEPYSGAVTGRWVAKVKNGVVDGELLTYHENGQLDSQHTLVNGLHEGEFREFHENGSLEYLIDYKNGEAHGSYQQYDENGELQEIAWFADGKMDGETRYYEGGYLKEVTNYKNGVLNGPHEKYFPQTKQLSVKGQYKDGLFFGVWSFFSKSGESIEKGSKFPGPSEGDTPSARFYPSGQVRESGMRRDGSKVGTWYYYDEEGALTETREFGDGGVSNDE